jgi:hypothetical protein
MDTTNCCLTDWVQLFFVAIGGLYALLLLKKSNKKQRNKILLDMIDRIYSDNEIKKLLYSIDQGKDEEEICFGGKLEKEADKTLTYLNYIGHLSEDQSINKKDLKPFEYELKTILENESIKAYIAWLHKIGKHLDYLNRFKLD